MSHTLTDRTLALAGVFQAAVLTQRLARDGRADPAAFRASIESLLKLDAPDVASVFGGAAGVHVGLTALRDRLAGRGNAEDMEIVRYAVALIHLERVLARRAAMIRQIGEGIDTAQRQAAFFTAADSADTGPSAPLVEKLAELYVQTISTLSPRIIVQGDHGHLQNPVIAARVRAALFAGIRAAWLWRQLGGRRWHLLFSRRAVIAEAGRLLAGG